MKFVFALMPALFAFATANAIEVGQTISIGQDAIQCTDIPARPGGHCSYCYGYGYGNPPRPAHAEITIAIDADGVKELTGSDTSCAAFRSRIGVNIVDGVVIEKDVKDLGSVKSIMLNVQLGGTTGPLLYGYGEI